MVNRHRLSYTISIIALIAILSTRVHQIVNHPELTEAQALIRYWHVWLGSTATLLVGVYLAIEGADND